MTRASEEQMEAWVEEGRADQKAAAVALHAIEAFARGMGGPDCPFGEEAPEARRRWTGLVNRFGRKNKKRDREQMSLLDQDPPGPDFEGIDECEALLGEYCSGLR